jgi:hypothetical protein
MYMCKQLERCASEMCVLLDTARCVVVTFTNDHSLTTKSVKIQGKGVCFQGLLAV